MKRGTSNKRRKYRVVDIFTAQEKLEKSTFSTYFSLVSRQIFQLCCIPQKPARNTCPLHSWFRGKGNTVFALETFHNSRGTSTRVTFLTWSTSEEHFPSLSSLNFFDGEFNRIFAPLKISPDEKFSLSSKWWDNSRYQNSQN